MHLESQLSVIPDLARRRSGQEPKIIVSPWSSVMIQGAVEQHFIIVVMENEFII